MELELAKVLVEIVNEEGGDCEVREGYSGRSMYGKTTTGIVGTSVSEVLVALLTTSTSSFEESNWITALREADVEIPDTFREDSMGMSDILY